MPIDPALAPLAQFMTEAIPYNRAMGLRVDHLVPGTALLRLPWRDDLTGDPLRPAVHGGVISALIDNAGGVAVFSTLDARQRCSTIDLRVDYLGPGPTGADLICAARVIRRGRRVAVTRMEVWSGEPPPAGDDRPPFAIGQASYSIFEPG
ncbi:MAG: hotdog domain-containing protein [bacterium]